MTPVSTSSESWWRAQTAARAAARRTPEIVAAQVAVEAIINDPGAYDLATAELVLSAGERVDVPDLYLSILRLEVARKRASGVSW